MASWSGNTHLDIWLLGQEIPHLDMWLLGREIPHLEIWLLDREIPHLEIWLLSRTKKPYLKMGYFLTMCAGGRLDLHLEVYCEFMVNGCSWIGALRNLDSHCEICEYREIQCTHYASTFISCSCGYTKMWIVP